MKKIKRILSCFIITALLCSGISMTALAASAQLRFSDPSTTVGAEVEVTATFTSDESVQSMDATLTFDTTMLRFIEGGSAKAEGGTITLSGAGDGTSTQLNFTLKFQALAEGTTVIEIASSTGQTTYGDTIDVTKGSSTITIGPGDPSLIQTTSAAGGGPQVDVNGVAYTVSGDFSEALIPEGFTKSEMQFEGTTCPIVTQESSGTTAMYLQPAEGDADFFLYNADTASFSPFEQVEIASGRYLIFMDDDGKVKIPSGYEKTSITVANAGKEFPAWQNTSNPEYYLVYGLNSDGTKALYQHDTVDGTYQRYLKAATISTDSTGKADTLLGKIVEFVGDHLNMFLIAACILFLLFLLILIVVAVKLRHRNLELDDLYDEYGIDLDDEEEEALPVKSKKANVKEPKEKRRNKKDEDDFYDFEDDDDEDEYDDYEDDDEDDYEEEEFEEYNFNDLNSLDDDDDSDIDDLDELLNARVREPAARPKKQEPKRRSHQEEDDTFKMDIIDLD